MVGFTNALNEASDTFFSTMGGGPEYPDFEDQGFWMSYSNDGGEFSMGPGYAWYLMIIAGIFSIITLVLMYSYHKYEPDKIIQATYYQPYPPPQ
jgi:lipoprotein signal peptidase